MRRSLASFARRTQNRRLKWPSRKPKKLKLCSGCHSNFYNGHNDMGTKECWNLDDAKVVMKKKVPLSQRPPWKQAPIQVLNCCHYDGYVLVGPKQEY